MKIKFKSIAMIFLFCCLFVSVGLLLKKPTDTQAKTAYVDNSQIFNQFKGKLEMESKFLKTDNENKAILDSIGLNIQFLRSKLESTSQPKAIKIALTESEYLYNQKRSDMMEAKQLQGQQYTEGIWSQINKYVVEYGEMNDYDYIYGIAGTGSMMYAKDQHNITPQVIKFINDRYEGY